MRRRRYTHVCAQALNISLQCITLHYGAEQQSTVHRLLARDWYSTVRKGLERGRGVIVDYLQHNKTAYLSHTTSPGQQQIHISSILRGWTWKLLRKLLSSNSSSNPQLTYYIYIYIIYIYICEYPPTPADAGGARQRRGDTTQGARIRINKQVSGKSRQKQEGKKPRRQHKKAGHTRANIGKLASRAISQHKRPETRHKEQDEARADTGACSLHFGKLQFGASFLQIQKTTLGFGVGRGLFWRPESCSLELDFLPIQKPTLGFGLFGVARASVVEAWELQFGANFFPIGKAMLSTSSGRPREQSVACCFGVARGPFWKPEGCSLELVLPFQKGTLGTSSGTPIQPSLASRKRR